MIEHTHYRSDDTDSIKTKLTIREELKMALDDHEKTCIGNNDLRYIKAPRLWVQIFAIVGILVAIVGGVTGSNKNESFQNEKDRAIEVQTLQLEQRIIKIETAIVKLNDKIDQLPRAVVEEINRHNR